VNSSLFFYQDELMKVILKLLLTPKHYLIYRHYFQRLLFIILLYQCRGLYFNRLMEQGFY